MGDTKGVVDGAMDSLSLGFTDGGEEDALLGVDEYLFFGAIEGLSDGSLL